jgi:NADH-quinone oxidoreductase subunit J
VNPVVFFVLAVLTVAAALTVVVHPNPVRSACALVLTLFLLSIFFVGLDAQLVAVLQVIVYAGAIVVLFLFVIMLLNLQHEERALGGAGLVAAALAGGVAVAGLVLATLRRSAPVVAGSVPAGFGETRGLSERLFTAYLLPFELTSVLLLVAIVGAVALGRRRDERAG